MQYPNDINALWLQWEQSVLTFGFEAEETQSLSQHIEDLEASSSEADSVPAEDPVQGLAMAHKLFDQLCAKKRPSHVNASQPGRRIIRTRFGAIYEHGISVRGIERLMKNQNIEAKALRLKDGFYHVNHLPGVQPTASEQVNARNKNVEKVNIDVVESFIEACKKTGMSKRGWKKAVNDQFEMSRQEFTKWLCRYFPIYGLPVPIERKN